MDPCTCQAIPQSLVCYVTPGLRKFSPSLSDTNTLGKEEYSNLTDSRVLANVLYCSKINRDKQNGKYDQYVGLGDDRDPEFKMVI